ncbi:ICP22 family protein [Arthrobacter ginkgonis]
MRSVLVSAGVGGALLLGAGPAQADPTASDAAPPSVQLQQVDGVPSQDGAEVAAADQAGLAETAVVLPADDAPAAEVPADTPDGEGFPEAPAHVELEDIGSPNEEESLPAGYGALDQTPADTGAAESETDGASEPGNADFVPEQTAQTPAVIEDETAGPQASVEEETDVPAIEDSGTPAAAPIKIGDRFFSPEDFNIPAEVANDPALIEEWFLDEANLDLLMESEGMLYLTDLMTELLLAEDWEGLEALFVDLLAGDEEAAAELMDWIYWMYEFAEEDGEDTGAGSSPGDTETEAEVVPAAVVKPAAGKTPARVAVSAAEQAAPQALRAAALAETGAGDTAAIAAGGFALVLAGTALTVWRRRLARA